MEAHYHHRRPGRRPKDYERDRFLMDIEPRFGDRMHDKNSNIIF